MAERRHDRPSAAGEMEAGLEARREKYDRLAHVAAEEAAEQRVQTRRRPGGPRWAPLIWLPLPLLILIAALVYLMGPDASAESAVLLATLNTAFCGVTSLALAFLAANTYRATAQRGLLALACAALALGVIYLVVGPLVGVSLDAALVLHNGGLLGTAALFVLSAVWISRDKAGQVVATRRGVYAWLSFSAVVFSLALLTLAALTEAVPPFYLPDQGVTPLRDAVLASAVLGFAVAALLMHSTYLRTRSAFLKWYALGLAMMAVGLGTVWLGDPASATGWVGRVMQWAAGVYLLAAIISAIADSGRWQIVVSRALRESEERYMNLVTMSPDAIVVQARDSCVFANPAAALLVGARSPDELMGRDVVDFFQLERREVMARHIAEARSGAVLSVEESAIDRLDGRSVEVDVTGSRVEHEGAPAVQLVIRDVTARKKAEAVLREHEIAGAAQAERSRLARDLHDSVTQALFAATLKAEALSIAAGDDDPAVSAAVEEVCRLSRGALAQMRAMLLELRGDPVEDVPIPQLLRNAAEAAESRASVNVLLTLGEQQAVLPPKAHEAVYRITQEALNNVVRHARAANVLVQFDGEPSSARLVISDDGVGFDPLQVDPGHFGLKSMQERAGESGGKLTLKSVPGEGTVLTVEWRLEGSDEVDAQLAGSGASAATGPDRRPAPRPVVRRSG